MGWYFRKSLNLGGGVRLNFSKSGVGVSGGVKGFRVSTGPRGTYVNIGGGGIYYREKIGGPYGQSPSSHPSNSSSTQPFIPFHQAPNSPLSTPDPFALLDSP